MLAIAMSLICGIEPLHRDVEVAIERELHRIVERQAHDRPRVAGRRRAAAAACSSLPVADAFGRLLESVPESALRRSACARAGVATPQSASEGDRSRRACEIVPFRVIASLSIAGLPGRAYFFLRRRRAAAGDPCPTVVKLVQLASVGRASAPAASGAASACASCSGSLGSPSTLSTCRVTAALVGVRPRSAATARFLLVELRLLLAQRARSSTERRCRSGWTGRW